MMSQKPERFLLAKKRSAHAAEFRRGERTQEDVNNTQFPEKMAPQFSLLIFKIIFLFKK